jgi:hypothetical protein
MAWPGAVSLSPVTELIRWAVLVEEELEHAGGWQPTCQGSGLVVRARLVQAVQQEAHAVRVVEGCVGGGPVRGARVRAQTGRGMAEV